MVPIGRAGNQICYLRNRREKINYQFRNRPTYQSKDCGTFEVLYKVTHPVENVSEMY